jgi:DNA-binding NtrC family response regulator
MTPLSTFYETANNDLPTSSDREPMKPLRVLVIDDESVICDACNMVLTEKGHTVDRCMTGETGLLAIENEVYDVILLDMKLPDIDGMKILKTVKKKIPAPCVIVMTGYSTMSNAVEAMKLGAADYLSKPFTDDELISAINESCGTQ